MGVSNEKRCKKSFGSVERSKYLQDKNINPRMLFKSTNKKFNFDCYVCNKTFYCQLSDITRGVWCSFCVNKTELILFNKLKETYFTLKRQYKVDWCKNKSYLPFDFVLKLLKIIIELDGPQHFRVINDKWRKPEDEQINDKYKMKCANENGFSVIRILQEDVYYDRYDWLSELITTINKIVEDNKVQNIYLCKNNEYDQFNVFL